MHRGVGGVEVNDGGDAMGMLVGDGAEFGTADGVADEDGMVEMQGVENGYDVVGEMAEVVVGSGGAGRAESAAGDGVNVVAGRELGREVVEGVCGVAASGEEDERAAGAAPVEDFEADVVGDLDELLFVGRGVGARRGGARGSARSEERERGERQEREACCDEAHWEVSWCSPCMTRLECEMFLGGAMAPPVLFGCGVLSSADWRRVGFG